MKDFNNLQMPKLPDFQLPDINGLRHKQLMENIIPVGELIEQQVKLQQEQLGQIKNNYEKLNELYKLKSKEAEQFENEAILSKKYNKKMLIIALISGGIAFASLISTILIAVLK